MKTDSKLTNETTFFQCHHNNTGFCKFGAQCRYLHFHTICLKNICRNPKCPNRHPKTCRFGQNCKYNSRNACVYRHFKQAEIQSIETRELTKQIEALKDKVKDLQIEISQLKINVQLKEKQLTQTKDILKETMLKNEDLNKELARKITLQETTKVEEKFKCNLCYFKAGQKKDLEDHNKCMHEQPSIIRKLKALLADKDKRIEFLTKRMLDINDVNVKNQNEEIKNPKNKDIENVNSSTQTNECPYCGKKFSDNSILKKHIINHSGPNILNSKFVDSEESDWETDDD